MAKNKPTLFADVIGQNAAKRRMTFYQQCYTKSGMMPNSMIVAQKGGGKTFMAKALAQHLMRDGEAKAKPFLEINCASLKNIRQFFNNVVIPHMIDKDITILFDEASEMPKDLEMGLLTILNPNKNHRNEFSVDDYVVDFDFRRHTFMFATSEPHKVFHALMDRLDRIDLEEYKNDELGKIVSVNLPDIKFEKDLLPEIATVLRGNARAAQKMANNIEMFHGTDGTFTSKLWEELRKTLGILPMGLNRIEVQVLRALAEVGECSLTNLAAKTGMTADALRRDFEMYLQKMNMMQIDRSGRSITAKGREYLEVLNAAA
jgi:Holliday junction resolvasome RuvABC ATP-dependent DNA helicase subunit